MEKRFYELILKRVDNKLFRFGNIFYRDYNESWYFNDRKNAFRYKNEVYYCRYYQEYFRHFISELLDLSRTSFDNCDEVRTYVFRRKMGIIGGDEVATSLEIAKELNVTSGAVTKYYNEACDLLIRYFIDYSYYHFIFSVNKSGIDKKEIFLRELYPYFFHSFDLLKMRYPYCYSFWKVGDLCEMDIDTFNKKTYLDSKCSELILHRLHFLGLGLKNENIDEVCKVNDKDFLLEMPVSVLNFSRKVNKLIGEYGIYNILGICLMRKFDFHKKGYGVQSLNEVTDKIHFLGLRFADENENSIVDKKNDDYQYMLVDTLYKKLEKFQYDLNSLVSRLNVVDIAISKSCGNLKMLQEERKKLVVTIEVTKVQLDKIKYEISSRDNRVIDLKAKVKIKEELR